MFEIEKIMFALFSLAFILAVIEYFYCCFEIHKLDKKILQRKIDILEKLYLEQLYKDYEQ